MNWKFWEKRKLLFDKRITDKANQLINKLKTKNETG